MIFMSGFPQMRLTRASFANRKTAPSATLTPTRPASRYDGPGVRVVLFLSGCLLRCTYCHNPDTWHLKDGTYIPAQQVLDRLAGFAPALTARWMAA